MMTTVQVNISEKKTSYDINIGSGFITGKIKEFSEKGYFFIIDKKVASLYSAIMPDKKTFIFKSGENFKTLSSLEKMLRFLKNGGCLRSDTLVVIGGGVTGDTAAMAASLYMRGIKLIQLPTTLLAMVDSGVGGKTAVNFDGIKNNIGSFYQPSQVIIDTDFLNTLSKKEFLNGFAECIKIAAISDKDFFDYLKSEKNKILKRDNDVMSKVIKRSCELKADIVEQDEKEAGIRKLLNFGHTLAHAIETDSKHRIKHGYAVAMGMAIESKIAFDLGYTDDETYMAITDILSLFGYPLSYSAKNLDIMLNAAAKDKKAGKSGIAIAISGKNMKGEIVNIGMDALTEQIRKICAP
ncbi:MAG: 3-dehydroquinate synthase [Mucispirillum sp.]|nr:3-dehydroquinate synthase [Mucispirillum sp.]